MSKERRRAAELAAGIYALAGWTTFIDGTLRIPRVDDLERIYTELQNYLQDRDYVDGTGTARLYVTRYEDQDLNGEKMITFKYSFELGESYYTLASGLWEQQSSELDDDD